MLRRFKVTPFHDTGRGGSLYPFNMSEVEHEVKRIFWVTGGDGASRGAHAHLKCKQTFICVSGIVSVDLSYSEGVGTQLRMVAGDGVTVEPGVWARQTYRGDVSTLLVLCSEEYDADDYVE